MTTSEPDNFTKHYIIAALWSSTDAEGNPLDGKYDLSDFAPEALAQAMEECSRFRAENAPLLQHAYDSSEYRNNEAHPDNNGDGLEAMAGHDFWLSRNGHGAGFFDRGNARFWRGLQSAARDTGMRDIYAGDDDQLYFS